MNDLEYWLTLALELDRIGVRGRRKPPVERLQEEGKHAVSKINRTVNMKRAIDTAFRHRERLKTVSQKRGVDEGKRF